MKHTGVKIKAMQDTLQWEYAKGNSMIFYDADAIKEKARNQAL